MKEFSEEVIEIDGVNYTLFLNRIGIVAWEKYSKEENKELALAYDKLNNLINGENAEITDETDPFAGLDDVVQDREDLALSSYKKLFWIMLRTHHHLSFNEASKLFDRAYELYGDQLVKLGDQMVRDANLNKNEKNGTKKLTALRPTE